MRRFFGSAALAVFAFGPAAQLAAQDTTKQQPPGPGPLRPYAVPAIQTATLPNGVKIALVERKTLPIVTARILVGAGAVREPRDKSGVAALTGSLLSEGTRELSGADLAERMAALGAQFSTGAVFGSANVNVTALTTEFPQAFRLAATTITEPRFAEADFNRIRATAIAGYEQQLASAEGVRSLIFSRAVYDSTTPYARLSGGSRASLSALTRDDVIQWHRSMYAPHNTTVIVVGDLSLSQAQSVVSQALGSWTAPAPSLAALANRVRPVTGTRVILVDRPGSVQTAIGIGQGTPGWEAPQLLALTGANQVLGGAVSSRLNRNLREKHGWTYGAFSSYNPLHGAGTFSIISSVRTNATDSAIAEAVREYRRIVSEPVPAEELRDQLNVVIASFPSSVQTVQGLLNRIATVVTYGLPLDFYTTYRERLAAVTPSDVSRLGGTLLKPDALTIVAVGDLKSIEAPIRALNLGTVEVWDAEGKQVR